MTKKISLIVVIIAIVLCLVYLVFRISNNNSSVEKYSGFFEQMISVDNYKLYEDGKYEDLANNFKTYCNERGLESIMTKREVRYNYNFIEKYNISGYKDLFVELIDESKSDNSKVMKYKISYAYVDSNGKDYIMTDYYQLNIKDGMIDYVTIDDKRSSISSVEI